ncbi:GNAT family N-acetyltransferase [Arthrobacter sp. H5]|uniref:GNAT family N-acetyltransferase n=1 Tax=Arthrobacter sp. H5 TaxID=1267973 RepID=UPI000483B4A5|nr:GNAT family N-acetyltransferase [Arthrobacter sp. H5]
MTIRITQGAPGDADQLAVLAALTFPLACPPTSRPEDIEQYLATELTAAKFAEHLTDPNKTLLCLRGDGHLLAYSLLIKGLPGDEQVRSAISLFPTIELSKFYVHPSHHGQGAASSLMEASLEAARLSGAHGIWLGTNDQNARAVRFYKKHGFAKVGAKTFRLGSGIETDFVLERAVADPVRRGPSE